MKNVKLIKVRDNQNRPVSGLDLMMTAVFGGSVPREFVSGEYYKAGEHVYYLDDEGELLVYECKLSGTYNRCEDPGFEEWSLESIIERYSNTIIDITKVVNDPILYEAKSVVVPSNSYEEYNGTAKFTAKLDFISIDPKLERLSINPGVSKTGKLVFDLNDYSGIHDLVDIYLRREESDSYIMPDEYEIKGNTLSVVLPLSEMTLATEHLTKFFPEGALVNMDGIGSEYPQPLYFRAEEYPELLLSINGDKTTYFAIVYDEDPYYWYGENGVTRSYPFKESGISLVDFDVLSTLNKPSILGYKICDLKIEAVHTIVESPLNYKQNTTVYRLDEILINGEHEAIGSNISDENQTIVIPIMIEPTRNLTDELYVTLDVKNQLLNVTCKNNHIKQIRFSLTARKLNPLSAYMVGYKAKSKIARFMQYTDAYGDIVEIDGEHYVKFPRYDLLKYNSFDFEVYHNRVFTSEYEEYISDDGGLYLKMIDESLIDYESDTFLFHIFYSISKDIAIARTSDTSEVVNDKTAFRIPLSTEYHNKFQFLKMRENYKLLPPEVVVGSKSTGNIVDPAYYGKHGDTLRADVFSMIIRDVEKYRRNGSIINSCNSESYPILNDTRLATIPFLDYDSEKDDFLIFKSGGVLLSSAKWYLDDLDVKLYGHETPLRNGDYLDFRLLDHDEDTRIYKDFLTYYDTDDCGRTITAERDLSKAAFILVFTMNGAFVSPSKYTIDKYDITFKSDCNQPLELTDGDRFEVVYGVFTGSYKKTIYTTLQLIATEDDQKEFDIEESLDFNIGSDNVLIFREDGMYIGERFYHTSEADNKIIIDRGTGIPKGSHIDVVIIRSLKKEILVTR